MEKKIKLIFLLPIICLCLFLTGCKHQDRLKDIHVIDNGGISYSINGFNYDNYEVEISYESGKTETKPLTSEMIDEHDQLLFYKSGTHEIKVNYKKLKTTFTVTIGLNTFSDDIKFLNKTVTFDGEAHKLEVTGDLPEGTKVIYKQGNEFTSAAVYDLNATLVCEGYYIKELEATLTIEKATYNLDNIKFEDKEYDYDGKTKRLEIEGNLPKGLQVTYEMTYKDPLTEESETVNRNTAVDANEYEVVAKFINSNTNYKNVEAKTATLNIKKAKYDLSDLKFESQKFEYDGKAHSIGITTEKLNHLIGDSSEIIVSYRTNDIPYSDKKIEFIDAGVYEIGVMFLVMNPNMEDIPDYEATLTIEPALLELDDVVFKSEQFDYKASYKEDETPTIYCNVDKNNCPKDELIELPIGVLFKGYKLEGSDDLLDKITQTEVGIYLYFAVFECGDSNYIVNVDNNIFAFLEITPMEYFIEGIEFKNTTVEYNGSAQSIEFSFLYDGAMLPEGIEVIYGGDGNTHTDAGTYNVTVEFKSNNKNIILKNTVMSATFTIKPKEVELTYTDDTPIIVESILTEYDPDKTWKLEVDESRLPENAEVKYKLMKLGYKDDLEINEKKNVGIYPYVITFKSLDKNIIYTNKIEAQIVIEPKTINITGDIEFKSKTYAYDPAGVVITYNYSKDATAERIALIEKIAVPSIIDLFTLETYPGRYIVKYTPDQYYLELAFESNDDNYRIIYSQYIVTVITISDRLDPITFSDLTVEYDGTDKMIDYKLYDGMSLEDKAIFDAEAIITYEYNGETYSIDTLPKFKDAGSYEITINVDVPDKMEYYVDYSKMATLTIKPMEVDFKKAVYFVNREQECESETGLDYIKTEIEFDGDLILYPSINQLITNDPQFKDEIKIVLTCNYFPEDEFVISLSDLADSNLVETSFKSIGYREYTLEMNLRSSSSNYIISYISDFQYVDVRLV